MSRVVIHARDCYCDKCVWNECVTCAELTEECTCAKDNDYDPDWNDFIELRR